MHIEEQTRTQLPNMEIPRETRRKSTFILLAGLLGICLILAGLILRGFWRPIVFASVIGIGFYPLHERINKLVRRKNASALLSTLFVLLIFVVPAAFLASAGSGDILHAAQYLNNRSGPGVSIFSNLSHLRIVLLAFQSTPDLSCRTSWL